MRSVFPGVLSASALFLAGACTSETGPASPSTSSVAGAEIASAADLSTEDQRILYMLGQYLGQNVADAALTEEELGPVFAGLTDSALGREPRVDVEQYGSVLPIFMQQRILAASESELAEASAFLDQEAAVSGATRTESGMVIQPIEEGEGARPTADDTVTVHYHGTLRDGRVFDSSVERGEPATFPLNQVIPCWSEGVQTMQVGGKSRFVCPPDLAYGPGGVSGIPGNSALVFDVELLDVVRE